MKGLVLLVLVAASFVAADDVLDLEDAGFDSTLEEIDTALVMFYAPW